MKSPSLTAWERYARVVLRWTDAKRRRTERGGRGAGTLIAIRTAFLGGFATGATMTRRRLTGRDGAAP